MIAALKRMDENGFFANARENITLFISSSDDAKECYLSFCKDTSLPRNTLRNAVALGSLACVWIFVLRTKTEPTPNDFERQCTIARYRTKFCDQGVV